MQAERRKLPQFPKFEQHSRIIPGPERIHESVLVKEGELLQQPTDGRVTTMYELLKRGIEVSNNGDFVGEKRDDADEYRWVRYEQVANQAQFIGSGLLRLGVRAGEATRVGIAGVNCPQYVIATFGLVSYSIVAVPLYHNYKFEALRDIVNRCELEAVFCDTLARAREFLDHASDMPCLKKLVVFKSQGKLISNGVHQPSGVELYDWDYLLKLGESNVTPVTPPSPSSVYIICHTSGTTGQPKGVKLTHRALLAAMSGLHVQWCEPPHCLVFDKDDVYFSFLSPAHSYEQLLQAFVTYTGGRIGIFGGDVRHLLQDIRLLKPTLVAFVPRVLNKFHETIRSQVRQKRLLTRFLFSTALKAKLKMLTKGDLRYDTIWDRFVLRKIHKLFGGRLRLITTGGAPISSDVLNFSRVVYGCPCFEGYGQTENAAAGCLTLPHSTLTGNVGGPAPWAQVKLVDVPELKYFADDDQGEICFRGAAIMNGYFLDDELTAKAVDEDSYGFDIQGWLHTGDIGTWLPDGTLRVIDRKNHFFKLSQGDFVAPEQVESVYVQSPLVSQVFVDGLSSKPYLVAIVIVNPAELKQFLAKQADPNLRATAAGHITPETLMNGAVRFAVITELRVLGASRGLNSIEQIKNLHLTLEEFSAESGMLTPTLKLRRTLIRNHYEKVIAALYEEQGNF